MKHASRPATHVDRKGVPDPRVTRLEEEVGPVKAGKHPLADRALIEAGDSQPGPQDGMGEQVSSKGGEIAGPLVVQVPEPLFVVGASLSDRQHSSRATRSELAGSGAERERVHGRFVGRERGPLMRCGQRLDADWARPAIDPGPAYGLAEAAKESVRVGQHPAIMPLPAIIRGMIGWNTCAGASWPRPCHCHGT